jgi:heme exporter protein C
MSISELASPHRFLSLARVLIPTLAALAIVLIGLGLALGFRAPPDYQQGEMVRVMYIHVPSAWISLAAYTLMAVASLGTLVWRHPLADVAAKAAAPIGAAFCLLCLVTGALWGRPMWGAYWVWDPRLTSELVLFLLYLGVMALWNAIDDPGRAAKAAAILTLVGFINVPIVKFSVEWWSSLHQGASVFRLNGPSIHPSILTPLLVSAAGFTALFFALHLAAMRNEILRRRLRTLGILAAAEAEAR